jgi:hypothetical protein
MNPNLKMMEIVTVVITANGWLNQHGRVLDSAISWTFRVVYELPPHVAASERVGGFCTVTQTDTVQGWLFR